MKRIAGLMILSALLFASGSAAFAAINVISYTQTLVDPNTGTAQVAWDDGAGSPVDAVFMYGTVSGAYPVTIAAGAAGTFEFKPSDIGMTGGVYYFRLSNTVNPVNCWSNEYRLFIKRESGIGFNFVSMSPRVFSPARGPLKIEFMPESGVSTSVRVSARILNMDGKHIVTVLESKMRTAGVVSVVEWDGRDKLGYTAKNGRYIVQVEIEDLSGKKQHVETVILVK